MRVVLLIIGCMLFGAVAVHSDSLVFSIFEKHRSYILSHSVSQVEGYVFSVASSNAIKLNSSGLERAREKAALKAQAGFVDPSFRPDGSWPPEILRTSLEKRISSAFNSKQSGSFSLKGLQHVSDWCDGGECFAVVAIEDKEFKTKEISWGIVLEHFTEDFNRGALALSPYDFLEICDVDLAPRVISEIAQKLSSRYGKAVGEVIMGDMISDPAVLWLKGKRLGSEKVSQLDNEGLFQLLNLDPYDPLVLYLLGQNFEQQGRYRFASLLYARGTTWLIDREYNELCGKLMNSSILPRDFARYGQGDVFEHQPDYWVEDFPLPSVMSGMALLVYKSGGSLPLRNSESKATSYQDLGLENLAEKVNRYYSAVDFREYALFLKTKGLNRASAAFMRQASYMDPSLEDIWGGHDNFLHKE